MKKPHYRRTADGRTVMIADGFQNAVAQIGTRRDKAAHASYRLPGRNDAELIAAYRTAWLPRKIVDIPAQDATRRWRSWNAEKEQISAIEAEETRLRLQGTVRDALITARLLGGVAIYLGTGDKDVSKPLIADRIGKGGLRHLTIIPRDQLNAGEIETDPESPEFGKPGHYELHKEHGEAVRIHPSRLVILHGATIPAGADRFGGDGWGDSALQSCLDAIKGADGMAASAASLVYEANIDVLHIPRLMELVSEPAGETKVAQYLALLGTTKGINGMLVLDGGDTSQADGKSGGTQYERKGAAFGGLGELWDRFMQVVSGAADIPATRLFGMSPAGQNATGESDQNNYAQRIAAMQSLDLGPAMAVLDDCLIRSALGSRPPEIYYDWRAIRETTADERAQIGKVTADIIATLAGADLFPVETLQQAAANAMIETGALPGLEAAVDEFGLDLDDPDEGDDLTAMPPARMEVGDTKWREQPRVPSGSPEGGQWGSTGSSWGPSGWEGGAGPAQSRAETFRHYTGEGYRPINWALRSGKEPSESAAKSIADMDAAFRGASLGEKATLYRGVGGEGVQKILGGGVRKGTIIEDVGFVSTSRSEGVAWQFARQYNNHFVMEIRASAKAKAIDIASFSDAPTNEREVLFNRSSRFKVVSYNKAKKVLVVEALDD